MRGMPGTANKNMGSGFCLCIRAMELGEAPPLRADELTVEELRAGAARLALDVARTLAGYCEVIAARVCS